MALAWSDKGSLLLTEALATVATAVTTTGGIEAIRYRTGAQPAQAASITPTGTLLATFTIVEGDMTATGNVVTIAASEGTTAVAAGTVAHFEAIDGAGDILFVGSVASPTGGDINIDNDVLANGQTVNLNTFTVTVPQGT